MKLQDSPLIAPTQIGSDNNDAIEALMDQFSSQWHTRLMAELPAAVNCHSPIVKWLVGNDRTRYSDLSNAQLNILKNAMDFLQI